MINFCLLWIVLLYFFKMGKIIKEDNLVISILRCWKWKKNTQSEMQDRKKYAEHKLMWELNTGAKDMTDFYLRSIKHPP